MKLFGKVRVLGFVLTTLMVMASACSATETVVIADGVAASATVTARANAAGSVEAATSGSGDEGDGSDESDGSGQPTAVQEPAGADADGTPKCTYLGVDLFDDIQIELAFTSSLREQEDATASYQVLSPSGEPIASSTFLLEELSPNERVRMDIDTLTKVPTRFSGETLTCALVGIESSSFGFEDFAPQLGDTCTFDRLDSVGDIQIRIDVTSPLDTSAELVLDYVLRGPEGVRFEDSVTFTEQVGPSEQVSTDVDTFTEFPDWVTESTFSCEVLSIQEF